MVALYPKVGREKVRIYERQWFEWGINMESGFKQLAITVAPQQLFKVGTGKMGIVSFHMDIVLTRSHI